MVPIPEGLVPTTIDFSYLNALNSANFGSVSGKLPARHDPRDLTPVRNQDPQDADIGTCWAQATIGSMETWLFLNGFGQNLFSVRNMVNREGWDSNSWFGGNHIRSSAYLLRWDGPVWESDDPYTNKNGIVNYSFDSPAALPAYHVQQTRLVPARTGALDNDALKKAILEFGGLYATMKLYTPYYQGTSILIPYWNENGAYYCPETGAGHAVTLVGWDDNYAKDNFNGKNRPAGNGAWIVKDSYGTKSPRDDGYIYVSYYDTTFAYTESCAFPLLEGNDNYRSIYQYDEYGQVIGWGIPANSTQVYTSGYGANLFVADTAEELAAVGFYAMVPNATYKIRIYVGCSASKPTSGTMVLEQTGAVDDYAGFYTIPLDETISVTKGQRFSAVVMLSTPGAFPFSLEIAVDGYVSNASANSGESFFSLNGSDWYDFAANANLTYGVPANFCCKVYTKSTSTDKPALSSIAIAGIPSMIAGQSSRFSCEARYSDGSKQSVEPTWSISEGKTFASVSAGGLVKALDVSEQQRVVVKAVYAEDGVEKEDTWGFYVTVAAPASPANVSASQGAESSCVRVNWTAPAGATEYAVYRATVNSSANAQYIDRVTVPKYNDTTATPGIDYWYFVKAKNSSGTSGFSEGARGWRGLAAPGNVSAGDGASVDFVTVTWDAVEGASCYRVFRAESFDGDSTPLTGWISATEFADSTAEPGTVYWYSVEAAVDSTGNRPSAAGIPDDGFRAVPVVPAAIAIEGDGAIPSGGTATYTAFALYSDGSRGESPLSPAWEVSAGTVSRTGEVAVPTVSANADIVISAQTTLEGVAISGTKTVAVTATAPGTPSNFRLVSATAAGVSLAWDAVPGASRYVVSRGASGGMTDFTTAEATFTDMSATPGVEYSYRVAAENAAGTGPQSAPVTVTIPLAAPAGVKATSDRTDGVRVTWGAVPGATHYRVARATSVSGEKTELGAWTADTAYLDTPPATDTAYFYFVKAAADSFGSNPGAWSEGIEGRMKPARTLLSLTVSGPDRVAAGGEAVYSCKASWSDGAEEAVSPAWSVSLASAGSIDANGRFAAASVSSDVGATVTATYGGKTGTASVTVLAPAAATAEITSVTAAQRWPFAGLVDIDYTLATAPAGTKAAVSVSAFDEDHGTALAATALSGDGADGPVAAGTHRLTWDLAADHPGFHAVSLCVNVAAVPSSLAAPTGLSATQGSSTESVSLAWTAAPLAVSYELWRGTGTDVASASRLAAQLTSCSFVDSGAVPGELYNYWVRAVGTGGEEGEWSDSASGYRAFTAPTNASATSTPSGVFLAWTGTSGNYIVYRAASANPAEARSIAALTESTYTYDLSSIFVTNHFWVAQCAPGKLRQGAMAYCGSGCKTLASPSGFTALGSEENISLSWSAVSGATSYEIWRNTTNISASARKIGSTAATSFADSTASAGVRYYYWTKAVRGGGTSAFSSSASAILLAPNLTFYAAQGWSGSVFLASSGDATTGETAFEEGETIYLFCGFSNTGSATISADYTILHQVLDASGTVVSSVPCDCSGELYRLDQGGALVWNGATFAVPSTLPVGQYTYRCVLDSDNNVVEGNEADNVSQIEFTVSAVPLAAPTGLAATASTSGISLSWSATARATSYEVYRATTAASSSATRVSTSSSTSWQDTTATPGTRYYYWVKAVGGSETSDFSTAANGIRQISAPASVTASDGTSMAGVDISWSSVPDALQYQVWRGTAAQSGSSEQIATVSGTSYTDTNTAGATQYYYWVKSVVGETVSDYSICDGGWSMIQTPFPEAFVYTSTNIVVSWPAVSGATSYQIYRSTSSSTLGSLLATQSTCGYTDSSVTLNLYYYYSVRAIGAKASSDYGKVQTSFGPWPHSSPLPITSVRAVMQKIDTSKDYAISVDEIGMAMTNSVTADIDGNANSISDAEKCVLGLVYGITNTMTVSRIIRYGFTSGYSDEDAWKIEKVNSLIESVANGTSNISTLTVTTNLTATSTTDGIRVVYRTRPNQIGRLSSIPSTQVAILHKRVIAHTYKQVGNIRVITGSKIDLVPLGVMNEFVEYKSNIVLVNSGNVFVDTTAENGTENTYAVRLYSYEGGMSPLSESVSCTRE